MKTQQIGPFVVKTLTVEQGLDLIGLFNESSGGGFQKALLLNTVTLNDAAINQEDFSLLVPHIAELLNAAMELNGFRPGTDDSVG